MVRGWYTSLSSMRAQETKLNTIANNLSNAETDGFKEDVTVMKAFPEMLLRRANDIKMRVPISFSKNSRLLGSIDMLPIVGKIGTGVEVNEIYTSFKQGSPVETENPFDLMINGQGFFAVKLPNNEIRYTRNGSFTIGKLANSLDTILMTKDGFPVLDENDHYIPIKKNNFKVDEDGNVFVNNKFKDNPYRLVSQKENQWEDETLIAKIKIVDFENKRYLKKQGNSLYIANENSGFANLKVNNRPKISQGFLESSNVNPVKEMVNMITAQRSYEANQKVIQAEDSAVDKLINQSMKI